MKTYYDFMSELSPDEVFEGLLGYGLFNEKQPQFLTSVPFYNYCINNPPSVNGFKNYVRFDGYRNVNIPRPYGIPEPFSYYNLCKCISDNWSKLCSILKENTINNEYKISRTHVRRTKGKPIFKMSYNNWRTDGTPGVDLAIGNKFMVCADISNCFPSI